ncbi:hypothetical protein [Lysinibacillus fusiformis]|uniref:hypothetical protein n=1 Tax=Lysinibacillus fusiformis TaxID=28031 RepID=UPI00263B7CA0|nr:hypothetical protein [Lysinibacillus fusiformis]MDC6267306.1 hypothetical protein [Lysinibacillus sphaericus]MDN4968260.1 hypothetical protein [Lysinibacillus fusiformis]MDN4968434.1 hypothetical protein [Lysinibacillus fusiformis]
MLTVEITSQYNNKNNTYSFNTLKEANDFLVNNGFIYDSGEEDVDYWVQNQFTFAVVRTNEEGN